MTTLPRIAASVYLNTAPLVWSFRSGSRRNTVNLISTATPRECSDLLVTERVTAALVPVTEYVTNPGFRMLPGVCVGARYSVGSVVLISKENDLQNIQRIALDSSSTTSAILLRIIFREFYGSDPEWVTIRPSLGEMLKACDAALMIGDPALMIGDTGFEIFDLAALWRRHTGLGFVFAAWMAPEAFMESARQLNFRFALEEGIAHLEDVIAGYAEQLKRSREELLFYLRSQLCFIPDHELAQGLGLFLELGYKHKLLHSMRDDASDALLGAIS